jgi:hypothetical protein
MLSVIRKKQFCDKKLPNKLALQTPNQVRSSWKTPIDAEFKNTLIVWAGGFVNLNKVAKNIKKGEEFFIFETKHEKWGTNDESMNHQCRRCRVYAHALMNFLCHSTIFLYADILCIVNSELRAFKFSARKNNNFFLLIFIIVSWMHYPKA